jgi:hypothetical protein
MTDAIRDDNHVPVSTGVSSTDATVVLPFKVNPATGRLLTDTDSGGSGDLKADGTVPMTADFNLDGNNIDNGGVIFLKEQAEADADVAGSGQIWVNTATPNELWFTDDAGTDFQLGLPGAGDLLADGTIPLTADWDVGAYTITAKSFVADTSTPSTFAGAIDITIADTVNDIGLTVTQNDTTNNPQAVSITNAGTGNGLVIDQNGTTANSETAGALFVSNTGNDGIGLNVFSDNTGDQVNKLVQFKAKNAAFDTQVLEVFQGGSGGGIRVSNNGAGNGIFIDQNGEGGSFYIDTEATSSTALEIYGQNTSGTMVHFENEGIQASGQLIAVIQEHATSAAGAVVVRNDGTGIGLLLDQNGEALALSIDAENTTSDAVLIDATTTTGDTLQISSSSLTTGRLATFYSNSSTIDNVFVNMHLDHASSTAVLLNLINDGTGTGIVLDQNGNARSLHIDSEATSLPAVEIDIVDGDAHLRLVGDSGNATPTEGDLWRESDGLKYYDGSAEQNLLDNLPLAGGTMTGAITLGENAAIALDPAGSADGKYSGTTVTGTAGVNLVFGDLVYLAVADSKWEKTDADAVGTAGTVMLGIVVVAGDEDASVTLLLSGIIRADAAFPTLTVGAPAYVGVTAAAIQVAAPSGTDDVVRVVGYALTANELYFNPSPDHITVTG